ncbi:MAG: phosphoribosylanthranilate isomerase [Bacteroidales bacterium]|jgi:phosphoribosylanthranilate isomerase
MIRIKVCGMCDSLNVKEIADAKPDFMGFIFYPGSPRYVHEEPEMAIFHNVPPGIKRIGVFLNENNHKILDISIRKGLDMIQLHGNESPVSCLQLKSTGLTIIKAFNIADDFSFESLMQYVPVCDYFLFDTKSENPGGNGMKFNWEKLKEYSLDKPFFLSGGIGPEDAGVIKSIGNRGFFAVDINSRFEAAPGIKNVSMVKRFIEEIKNEQQ